MPFSAGDDSCFEILDPEGCPLLGCKPHPSYRTFQCHYEDNDADEDDDSDDDDDDDVVSRAVMMMMTMMILLEGQGHRLCQIQDCE